MQPVSRSRGASSSWGSQPPDLLLRLLHGAAPACCTSGRCVICLNALNNLQSPKRNHHKTGKDNLTPDLSLVFKKIKLQKASALKTPHLQPPVSREVCTRRTEHYWNQTERNQHSKYPQSLKFFFKRRLCIKREVVLNRTSCPTSLLLHQWKVNQRVLLFPRKATCALSRGFRVYPAARVQPAFDSFEKVFKLYFCLQRGDLFKLYKKSFWFFLFTSNSSLFFLTI